MNATTMMVYDEDGGHKGLGLRLELSPSETYELIRVLRSGDDSRLSRRICQAGELLLDDPFFDRETGLTGPGGSNESTIGTS